MTHCPPTATAHNRIPKFGDTIPRDSPIVKEFPNRSGVSGFCDLSAGSAYNPAYQSPPIPIIMAFGAAPLSECSQEGRWDFDRAVEENPDALVRSAKRLGKSSESNNWYDLIFQFGTHEFLHGNSFVITAYALNHKAAERIAREFTAAYGKKLSETGGSFQLIQRESRDDICYKKVTLKPESALSDEDFVLHYPGNTTDWHRSFVTKLSERSSGLSILEGRPGTGKTSYLRHLMGALRDTHKFYFLPPSNLDVLISPEFIGFWSKQREFQPDHKLVVILEDAEEALMPREADNREKVSAILNLSDGMLSDFVGLHVICTINCSASEIDQALLRPGRLVSHKIFNRLDPVQASALSATLGKVLPTARDYSLAEVFAGEQDLFSSKPAIGFS